MLLVGAAATMPGAVCWRDDKTLRVLLKTTQTETRDQKVAGSAEAALLRKRAHEVDEADRKRRREATERDRLQAGALEEKKAKQEEETKAANEKKASTRRRFGDTEQKRKQPPTPSRKQQLADEIVLQNEVGRGSYF